MREKLHIEKRNGEDCIGVVLSTHRVGWATWNRNQRLATDPLLVQLVDQGAPSREIIGRATELEPRGHFTAAQMSDRLTVRWVPVGHPFRVVYDPTEGGETIEFFRQEEWIATEYMQS